MIYQVKVVLCWTHCKKKEKTTRGGRNRKKKRWPTFRCDVLKACVCVIESCPAITNPVPRRALNTLSARFGGRALTDETESRLPKGGSALGFPLRWTYEVGGGGEERSRGKEKKTWFWLGFYWMCVFITWQWWVNALTVSKVGPPTYILFSTLLPPLLFFSFSVVVIFPLPWTTFGWSAEGGQQQAKKVRCFCCCFLRWNNLLCSPLVPRWSAAKNVDTKSPSIFTPDATACWPLLPLHVMHWHTWWKFLILGSFIFYFY